MPWLLRTQRPEEMGRRGLQLGQWAYVRTFAHGIISKFFYSLTSRYKITVRKRVDKVLEWSKLSNRNTSCPYHGHGGG